MQRFACVSLPAQGTDQMHNRTLALCLQRLAPNKGTNRPNRVKQTYCLSCSGPAGHLQLQDIQVVLSASLPASLPAASTDPLSSGTFRLSSRHSSSSLPAHSPSTPLSQAPAHHWLWRRTEASPAASVEAAAAAAAAPSSAPTTSKPSGINPTKATKQGKTAKGSQGGPVLSRAESSPATGQVAASLQSSSEAGASSSSAEGGLVEMACIAVRPVESVMHSQPSLAATKLYGAHAFTILLILIIVIMMLKIIIIVITVTITVTITITIIITTIIIITIIMMNINNNNNAFQLMMTS